MAIRERQTVVLPELRTGMRLSADEFDRRYDLRHDIKKAELVQGVVYVASPVSVGKHGIPDSGLSTWIGAFAATRTGVAACNNGSTRLGDDRVQPDSMLFKTAGGSSSIGDDDYLYGAPELAVEVTSSSRAYDMTTKRESYRRAGVQEYVVWLTRERRILWLSLEQGDYIPLLPNEDGWTYSKVFPGLRLHIARLLAGDTSVILPGAS